MTGHSIAAERLRELLQLHSAPGVGEDGQKQIDDTLATRSAINEAANLNKIAAKWTACSVALNALSAICALA